MRRHIMVDGLHKHKALLALFIAGAILSVMLMSTSALATAPNSTDGGNRDFPSWLFMQMQAPMYVFLAIFAAGAMAGAGIVYLEYHVFRISFELFGRIVLFSLPFIAIIAIASTLALHKYNYFLLSLYLAVPMIIAPAFYVVYKKFIAPGNIAPGNIDPGTDRKHL